MIEAFTQEVTLPLWVVFLLSAYSSERIARMIERARGLRTQTDRGS